MAPKSRAVIKKIQVTAEKFAKNLDELARVLPIRLEFLVDEKSSHYEEIEIAKEALGGIKAMQKSANALVAKLNETIKESSRSRSTTLKNIAKSKKLIREGGGEAY